MSHLTVSFLMVGKQSWVEYWEGQVKELVCCHSHFSRQTTSRHYCQLYWLLLHSDSSVFYVISALRICSNDCRLGWALHWGLLGIWAGLTAALFGVSVVTSFFVLRLNWPLEAKNAKERSTDKGQEESFMANSIEMQSWGKDERKKERKKKLKTLPGQILDPIQIRSDKIDPRSDQICSIFVFFVCCGVVVLSEDEVLDFVDHFQQYHKQDQSIMY